MISGAALFSLVLSRSYAIWYDEVISLRVAALPWRELLAGRYTFDANPPLHYALVKLATLATRDPEPVLRALSIAAHLASIVLVYRIGATVRNPITGLLAALIYAMNPVVMHLSLVIRLYALVAFFANTCVLALATAWRCATPDAQYPARNALVYALLATATHTMACCFCRFV